MNDMNSIGTAWLWSGFFGFVLCVFAIDFFVMGGRKTHRISMRQALSWTVIWVMCALIFNFFLWWHLSQTQSLVIANQKALEFLAGYLIEESLSMDNLFVFLLIFGYFLVPHEYQRRVLLYGVLGAIFMRFVVILFGIMLVIKIHWILYLFGLFLIITGIKMLLVEEQQNLADNVLLIWLRRHIRVTDTFHAEYFFVRQNGKWFATPLFLVLILVEISDLIFAIDSIPAVFAITQDPFIVFTSNIFAVLGLRSLYFLLARMATRFHLLKFGIAIMLTFVGVKMLIDPWIKIPILVTLGLLMAILMLSTVFSILIPAREKG